MAQSGETLIVSTSGRAGGELDDPGTIAAHRQAVSVNWGRATWRLPADVAEGYMWRGVASWAPPRGPRCRGKPEESYQPRVGLRPSRDDPRRPRERCWRCMGSVGSRGGDGDAPRSSYASPRLLGVAPGTICDQAVPGHRPVFGELAEDTKDLTAFVAVPSRQGGAGQRVG